MNLALLLLALTDVGSGEDDTSSTVESISLLWFVFLPVVGLLIYSAITFAIWPHARPIVPIWFLLFFIFFPPFLPFLLLYVFLFSCFFSPGPYNTPHPTQVIVVVDESVNETKRMSQMRGSRRSEPVKNTH
jgi:magnesium-transporting ATPase (P-type)